MSYALYLLAASCVPGAPPAAMPDLTPPATSTAPAAPGTPAAQPAEPPAQRLRLRDRIRRLFHDDAEDGPTTYPPYSQYNRPASAPTAAPATKGSAAAPAATPVQRAGARASGPRFELSKQEEQKVGHEKDYSWITGKLFRLSTDGRFVLRYAGQYEVDRYEGSVLLAQSPELASFREGDMVCVQGRVIEGIAGKSAGAVYEVKSAYLIERAH